MGQCWRMGCLNVVAEGKVGCAEHDALDIEDERVPEKLAVTASASRSWELEITSASRLVLERALARLLDWDAALLRAAITGEPIAVPTVHLSGGEATADGMLPSDVRLPRCGAISPCVTSDSLAATCIACKK